MSIPEWWLSAGGIALVLAVVSYRRLGAAVFGPLYGFELVRLARRGTHLRLRVVLVGMLLVGLLATYVSTFPDTDLRDLLFGGTEAADSNRLQAFGGTFLIAFLIVQQAGVILLTPVFAGGAIAEEKERGGMDFLLTSHLTRWELVVGKLAARLTFVLAVLAAGLPVLLFTLLFGAVSVDHLLAGFAVAAVTAMSVGGLAVMLSVYRHTLRDVLLWSYGLLAAVSVGGFCLGGCLPLGTVASPVSVLWRLIAHWVEGTLPDPTWDIAAAYATVHLTAAAVFLSLALWRVRTHLRDVPKADDIPPVVTEPDPEPPRPAMPEEPPLPDWYQVPTRRVFEDGEPPPMLTRGRGFVVPKLTDDTDPFVWKERHFSGRLPLVESQWASMLTGCVTTAFLFVLATGLFVGAATELSRNRWVDVPVNVAARLFLVAAVLAVPLVGVRAAVSVGEERAKQTLVSLLTLPVPRRDILRAKGWAAVVRSRWLFVGVGVATAGGLLTGGLHFAGVLAVVSLCAGFTAFVAAAGLWLSVRCAGSLRAVMFLILVALALVVGPVVITPLLENLAGTGGWAGEFYQVSPPWAVWSATDQVWNGQRVTDGERLGAGRPAQVFVIGLGYLAAAWGVWEMAARRFDREGRE